MEGRYHTTGKEAAANAAEARTAAAEEGDGEEDDGDGEEQEDENYLTRLQFATDTSLYACRQLTLSYYLYGNTNQN